MTGPAAGGATAALARRPFAGIELRERETRWWQEHAEIEERYTWVLPEALQPPPRERYLDAVAAHLDGCAHVVDYGCGNGWVARRLRRRLGARVTGVDFSPAQIALARAQGGADIDYRVIAGPQDLPPADGYLFHGLLHHLPGAEIDDLLAGLARCGAPGARIALVEPVCFPGHEPDAKDRAVLTSIAELLARPRRAAAQAGVVASPHVAAVREQADRRWWGELPYGPSPMEKPFEHDELARVLGQRFQLRSHEIVQFLGGCQALGGELALLADDAPALAHALAAELYPSMDLLERTLLRFPRPPDAGWYLAMTLAVAA